MNFLSKLFSFSGRFSRGEYLLYGYVVPSMLVIFGMILHSTYEVPGAVIITLFIALYMHVVATVKRARDTASSVGLIMFLWLFLTPIAIIYLLFAPTKKSDDVSHDSFLRIIIIVLIIIVVFGIVSALLLPKFVQNPELQTQQQTELSAQQRKEFSESLYV